MNKQGEFSFNIVEKVAILSTEGEMSKELNLISFNGNPAKYDLRNWQDKGYKKRMLKGIVLSVDEAKALKAALNSRAEL